MSKRPAVTSKPTKPVRAARDDLDVTIREINKSLGEGGSLQRGADIDYMMWERRTTGSLGLDIIMGGGLPCAALIQFKGIESCFKTTMALHACAEAQKHGHHIMWAAAEGFDKHWARTNGVYIPYNDKELHKLIAAGRLVDNKHAQELADEYSSRHKGYGDFILGVVRSGPLLLESTSKVIRTGVCALVVVDSLGAILTEEDDDKEIGDATRVGGNAKIIGHFVNKVRLSFNSMLPRTDEDGNSILTPNKTSCIVINQMRANIGGYSPQGAPPPEAPGGYGLRHGKDVDILFTKGELLKSAGGRNKGTAYGRVVKAKCDKNKTAPPHKTASWYSYFRDEPSFGVKAGTIDLADEVLQHGIYFGLIERRGAWVQIGEESVNGTDKALELLRHNPELVEQVRGQILDLVAKGQD